MDCNENKLTGRLISIMSVEEGLKSDIVDCIKVRSKIDKREIKNEDIIAIINIVGSTSYQVFFLDGKDSIEHIKKELNKMGVVLNYDSLKSLERYVERMD